MNWLLVPLTKTGRAKPPPAGITSGRWWRKILCRVKRVLIAAMPVPVRPRNARMASRGDHTYRAWTPTHRLSRSTTRSVSLGEHCHAADPQQPMDR
jgi:hypothetical protein